MKIIVALVFACALASANAKSKIKVTTQNIGFGETFAPLFDIFGSSFPFDSSDSGHSSGTNNGSLLETIKGLIENLLNQIMPVLRRIDQAIQNALRSLQGGLTQASNGSPNRPNGTPNRPKLIDNEPYNEPASPTSNKDYDIGADSTTGEKSSDSLPPYSRN